MIADQLTAEHVPLEDGTTAFLYEWRGESVAVRDDALTVIKIMELYRRNDIDDNAKGVAILERMFPNPSDAFCACNFVPGDFAALIKAVDSDVYGITIDGKPETPLWDIEQDAAIIRTSLRMAYGIDWDKARCELSWAELIALIGSLPYDTPLGNRIYYRNPENRPKRTKTNREQVAEFDRLHRLYKLTNNKRKGSQDRVIANQHAMDDLALAMRKRRE